MIRIAICDESLERIESTENLLQRQILEQARTIDCYQSGESLLEAMNGKIYDVVFVRIGNTIENGVETACKINCQAPATQIVYIMSDLSQVSEIADTAYAYFLVEPIAPAKLARALEKIKKAMAEGKITHVLLPLRGGADCVFQLSQIVYFERMRRTTVINCTGSTQETMLRISELEQLLPDTAFARPHNSYLVNLSHVNKLERFCLHLDNAQIIPISNQKRSTFRQTLAEYYKQ